METKSKSKLWYEKAAREITPGDFIMLREGKVWVPKVVRQIEQENGKVVLSWWVEKHIVEQEFDPDELLEML